MLEPHTDPWTLYMYSLKSPASKEKYPQRLAKFLAFAGLPVDKPIEEQARAFANKGIADTDWAFTSVVKFVMWQLDRVSKKEIVASTVRGYVKAIKLFCEVADIPIQWKKITRGLPRARRYADDRAPTVEEIKQLAEYPDRRIKAIIYSMASGGFRLGAWDYLKWGHVKLVESEGRVVAARVVIYAGEDEEYVTFISAEAYQELVKWMKQRVDAGETITEDSWLMRDLWDTRIAKGRGKISEPKQLTSMGVKRLIERAHWAQGLRKKLDKGKRRHPYQAVHSLRKWYKTRCELAGMKPINVETLMGHSVGISDSYYRPTETELLEDYTKAIPLLTFNKEKQLSQEVEKLKVGNEQLDLMKRTYLDMKLELEKKDNDIKNIYKALYDKGIFVREGQS